MNKFISILVLAFMTSWVMAGPMYLTNTDDGAETFYLDDLGGAATNSLFEIKLESAGYANNNSFGIYQIGAGEGVGTLGLSVNFLELFSGSDGIGHAAKLSWNTLTDSISLSKSTDGIIYNAVAVTAGLTLDHTDFGFYLDTPDGLWFSQTALNLDGIDHMVAFEAGAIDSWILAWEDLYGGGDQDYNDFVLLADDVLPVRPRAVPEPSMVSLLGLGLVGMGFVTSRRKYFK